jgi:hypothetical protein
MTSVPASVVEDLIVLARLSNLVNLREDVLEELAYLCASGKPAEKLFECLQLILRASEA